MSSGPEMAGVGIFFQQEPTSGRVYVANIVEKGSADRSGVIRVNDVIVKVDDEDVQGQPLSTLRNLILGKQGSYVVLAFRRMTGTELYYFDVELVRGTPEYFESLKKSQAVADEKEKLLMQVRQQEQDIRALKQQSQPTTKSPMSEGPGADVESIKRAIAAKSEEIARMEAGLQRERGQTLASKGVAEQALVQLRAENKRLGDTLNQETQKFEDMKKRMQQQASEWQETRSRLQAALKAEIGAANSVQGSSGFESENARLRKELDALDQRDQQAQQALRKAQQDVEEVTRNNEANLKLLQELAPALESIFSSVFISHGLDPAAHMQGRA
jgi:chromosome segregation ATPase